jgi:hypothetical protein
MDFWSTLVANIYYNLVNQNKPELIWYADQTISFFPNDEECFEGKVGYPSFINSAILLMQADVLFSFAYSLSRN